MLMADVFSITLSILGFFLALQGVWLLCLALWPRGVARAQAIEQDQPLRAVFVGAPLTLGVFLVAVMSSQVGGPAQAFGFALLAGWLLFASVGVAGFASLIGERLASPVDERRPWRRTVRGGAVLELAFLFPILGWFLLLPIVLVMGTGAAALGLRKQREAPAADLQGAR